MKRNLAPAAVLRWLLVALGVVYPLALGMVGEAAIGSMSWFSSRGLGALPLPTRIILTAFGYGGRFLLSLTPFMMVVIGLAAVAKRDRRSNLIFLPCYVAALLGPTILTLVIGWAVMLPTLPLSASLAPIDDWWFVFTVLGLDVLIAAAFVWLHQRGRLRG